MLKSIYTNKMNLQVKNPNGKKMLLEKFNTFTFFHFGDGSYFGDKKTHRLPMENIFNIKQTKHLGVCISSHSD